MRCLVVPLLLLVLCGCAAPQRAASRPLADSAVLDGMVHVPGGNFSMGIAESEIKELVTLGREVPHMGMPNGRQWFRRGTPLHEVTVSPFLMDAAEVSNRQFRVFVEETGYEARGDWRSLARSGREEHPVLRVTWQDAEAYAEWAGKRLPTEAEWEWAARGGAAQRWFPWGDTDPERAHANYGHDRSFLGGVKRLLRLNRVKTAPRGCYAPNGYGLFDVIGNAAEWCADDFRPYPGAAERTPPWDEREFRERPGKVVRGGSWSSPNPVFARVNSRASQGHRAASSSVGFRCARSL